RTRAFQIADQRRHSLRKRETDRPELAPGELDPMGEEEQLSLFAALSSVATDEEVHAAWDADDVDDDLLQIVEDPDLLHDLAPPPPLSGEIRSLDAFGIGHGGSEARTRREEKKRLRERNAELVSLLVRRSGRSPAQVNAELNRLAGIGRITEATIAQLRTRLEAAERMARR